MLLAACELSPCLRDLQCANNVDINILPEKFNGLVHQRTMHSQASIVDQAKQSSAINSLFDLCCALQVSTEYAGCRMWPLPYSPL